MSNTSVSQRASGQTNNRYTDLVNRLSDYREAINKELNLAKFLVGTVTSESLFFSADSFESSFLKGQCYKTYCDKKNDWLDQHDQIIASFDGFLADLDVCIRNAQNRANS